MHRRLLTRSALPANSLVTAAVRTTHLGRPGSSPLSAPTTLLHNAALNVLDYAAFPMPAPLTNQQPPQVAIVDTYSVPSLPYCSTKIVATIGPSCNDIDVLMQMMAEGMDIARLNFSHGSYDEHKKRYNLVREAARRSGLRDTFAIALDTKGPEIRTLPNKGLRASGAISSIHYANDAVVKVHLVGGTPEARHGYENDADNIYVAYPPCEDLKVGSTILIADGNVELRVTAIDQFQNDDGRSAAVLTAVVVCGATLSGRNNAHFPGVRVQLPALSAADVSDIHFGVAELGVDMIFASFARSAQHIEEIRKVVEAAIVSSSAAKSMGSAVQSADTSSSHRKRQKYRWVPIIAKIESVEGIENLDAIIDASDGIMIARGDLGMDIPIERMFMAQKLMAARSNLGAKPVICATQLLESMTDHPRPTRAEATDVANAVLDGVDAVMLSGETAKGRFPVASVRTLRYIVTVAESTIRFRHRYSEMSSALASRTHERGGQPTSDSTSIADAAVLAAFDTKAACIITTTITGDSVRALARLRPPCPIVAVCYSRSTCRSLALSSGVIAVFPQEHSPAGVNADSTALVKCQDGFPVVSAASTEEWATKFEALIAEAIETTVKPMLRSGQLAASFGNANPSSSAASGLAEGMATIVVTNTDQRQVSALTDCHASMSVRHIKI